MRFVKSRSLTISSLIVEIAFFIFELSTVSVSSMMFSSSSSSFLTISSSFASNHLMEAGGFPPQDLHLTSTYQYIWKKKVLGKKFWIKPVWHMQTKPQFIDQGVVLLVIKTIPQKIPFPTLTSLDSITSIAAPFWITGALGFTSTVTLNIIKI